MKITVEIDIPAKLVKSARATARSFSIPLEKFIRFSAVQGTLSYIESSADDDWLTLGFYTFPNRETVVKLAREQLGDWGQETDAITYLASGKEVHETFSREELGLPPARSLVSA
jgi:hypothetical protein